MPLVFIAIGILFTVAAVRGTVSDKDGQPGLITLLKGDFWGQSSFLPWVAALFIIGAIGYIPGLKPVSWAFFLLVLIVILLANNSAVSPGGGFFKNFMSAIQPNKV